MSAGEPGFQRLATASQYGCTRRRINPRQRHVEVLLKSLFSVILILGIVVVERQQTDKRTKLYLCQNFYNTPNKYLPCRRSLRSHIFIFVRNIFWRRPSKPPKLTDPLILDSKPFKANHLRSALPASLSREVMVWTKCPRSRWCPVKYCSKKPSTSDASWTLIARNKTAPR